ncbi:hypothetical protein BCD67_07975 [Oscillatoriales cyanobacterium USR001]|nr:hypothetical protein BCD67_07975 [Oscillatoriales cyanobacterium USR001]
MRSLLFASQSKLTLCIFNGVFLTVYQGFEIAAPETMSRAPSNYPTFTGDHTFATPPQHRPQIPQCQYQSRSPQKSSINLRQNLL